MHIRISTHPLAIALAAAALVSACALERASAPPQPPVASASAEAKKQRFFAFLRPIVERENARILAERERILQLSRKRQLQARERAWLSRTAASYGLKPQDWTRRESWERLLARVDAVPVELVLVQAANESAWGTSRFAREGNNYFGQWCFTKGCGIVPRHRPAGATHEVTRFASVAESVRSYLHNLNTSAAYAELRRLRAEARRRGRQPDALALAAGLRHYSERGQAYVRTLQAMIRQNARLMDTRG